MADLSFQLRLDSIDCNGCGEEIWIGAEACPLCGMTFQPGAASEAHLYRSRVAIFESLLEHAREPVPTSVIPVTDWQYLRYIQDSDLLDSSPLADTARVANALKLQTPSEIRSLENRAGTQRLIRNADRYRRILLDLGALRPTGRFDEVNPHLLVAFKAFLKMIEELASTLVAWSPNEAQTHASAMQAALDRASEELASAREKMEEAFPEGLEQLIEEERRGMHGNPVQEQAAWLRKVAEADQRRANFQDMAAEGLITFDELRTKLAALEETRQLARRELASL